MSNDVFDVKILAEKLSKLNNSQQSIESLSRWCISHRKKARQVVESWERMFNLSQKEQCVSFLYLANDILQNSRRKGNEFVNEFWKVLPGALKHVYDKGDDSGKKAATRLVDIWEERKVFGSRVQSLKDELVVNQVKDPPPQVVSNGKSSNPIKIVKKDAQSLRIKMAVGEFPEKIVSAFYSLHEECSNEESNLVKCNAAVFSVEKLAKEVELTISQGIQPGIEIADEMQEQESVLQQCVRQLEGAEASRVSLVSLLQDALQDQEAKLESLRGQLQVARFRINKLGVLRPKVLCDNRGVPAAPVGEVTEALIMGELNKPAVQATSTLQVPQSQPVGALPFPMHEIHQPPSQPAVSFPSVAATGEESKKAAAAALVAKVAASPSSIEMFTSVFSSFAAEHAASMNDSLRKGGYASSLPMLSPEKRRKLEQPLLGADGADPGGSPHFTPLQQPTSTKSMSQGSIESSMGPPPPPPPPLLPPNNQTSSQFVQSAGMMLNMMPYGFVGNGLPPPPPMPSHLAMGLPRPPTQQGPPSLQSPQQPDQQQSAGGGYYRPPGIGLYGSSSQPSTSPVQRQ